MNYNEIEDKYIKAEIKGRYKLANAEEVKTVLGFDLTKIKGFDQLSQEHQQLAERFICGYINGHGLQAREDIKPTSIKREKGKFVLKFKDGGYSYLYDNGTVG